MADEYLNATGVRHLNEENQKMFAPMSHKNDKDNPHDVTQEQIGMKYASYLDVMSYLDQ